MAVSIVNGFFCANSCDVSKAKKGEDPHPSTSPDSAEAGAPSDPTRSDQPAVLFGGALDALNGASQVNALQPADDSSAADPAALWTQNSTVDILA